MARGQKRTGVNGNGGPDPRLLGFLGRLQAALQEAWIPGPTGDCTLRDYLAASPNGWDGDEQKVVDALTRRLLAALGWEEGTGFLYNATDRDGSRPDFQVRMPGRTDLASAFIVEDKSTATRDLRLRVRKRLGDEAESPLEQLRRYVINMRSSGRIGLLCNGWTLQGWTFTPDGPVQLLHLDLAGLDLAAMPRAAAAPNGDTGVARDLATLWTRFSRDAWDEANEAAATLQLPPPPPEVIAMVQAALRQPDDLAAFRKVFRDWWEKAWRDNAIDVARSCGDTERLVAGLRGLIGRFSADVRHQLDRALFRAAIFDGAISAEERRDEIDRAWDKVAAARARTSLSEDEFESLCLEPLRRFRISPAAFDRRVAVAVALGNFQGSLRKPEAPKAEQGALPLGGAPVPANGRDLAGRGRQWKKEMAGLFQEDAEAFVDAVWRSFHTRLEVEAEFGRSKRAGDAFVTWRRRVSASVLVETRKGTHTRAGTETVDEETASEEMLRDEFSRQTAYVYVVRLLLVRICEDKGLFARKLSDGALVDWDEQASRYLDFASGRSYEYLTSMAYECAQNVYAHLFGSSRLFDWYEMDSKMLLHALAELNRFDLARIDTDIIGTVYGGYLTEGKHDQGRYYTPPGVVRKMLDLAGWTRHAAVGRRLLDASCGSGSFLVEAARRVIDQYRGPDGIVPAASVAAAIQEVKQAIWGIDLNPFACYLAETNLLIQVLDLIRQARTDEIHIVVDRFRVYCDDSLMVNRALAESGDLALQIQQSEDQAVPELVKARAGPHRSGFDVVVGNPPYVRADAKAPRWRAYRDEVQAQHWPTTLHMKWDLYVPFIEQAWRLLSDAPSARACQITINSIETAPYAAKLREFLARRTVLRDIVFTRDLDLFDDATWQDNVILTFSRGTPKPGDVVRRWVSDEIDGDKVPVLRELDGPGILATEPDRLLNRKEEVALDLEGTVPWEELCYVTKGMVLHSNEKLADGQEILVPPDYDEAAFGETLVRMDPRGRVIRHKSFVRTDLVSSLPDALHSRPYIEPTEVLRGGLGRVAWLEYGSAGRCPARVDRPTFPQLYQRPKVMFGTFAGVAVDPGGSHGFLCTSHSVSLTLRWCLLRDLDNRSLAKARRELGDRYDPVPSESISDWYLCAIALSDPVQRWLAAGRRSMKEHVYPDDIRRVPVKLIPPLEQQPFVDLARELHALHARRIELEDGGFSSTSGDVAVPAWSLVRRFLSGNPAVRSLTLFQATGAGLLLIEPDWLSRDLGRIHADGEELRDRSAVVGRVGQVIVARDRLAPLFAELLRALPSTFADRQAQDRIPADEDGLLELAAFLDKERARLPEIEARISAVGSEIDERAWALYRPKTNPPPAGS